MLTVIGQKQKIIVHLSSILPMQKYVLLLYSDMSIYHDRPVILPFQALLFLKRFITLALKGLIADRNLVTIKNVMSWYY
jgi:hypothetical protein